MIDPDDFESLAADLARLNSLDPETAYAAALKLGDRRLLDEQDRATVTLDDGRELQLVLPEGDEE